MHFQLEIQRCISSRKDITAHCTGAVGETEVYLNGGDRSVLSVRMTEVHFQLGSQKCTSSRGDRSAVPVENTEVQFRLG